MRFQERVPDLLEPHRCIPAAVGPQQRDHLAECADTTEAGSARENIFDGANKQDFVRPFVDHETGKNFGRLEADEPPFRAQGVEHESLFAETLLQADSMRFGPDVHACVARIQTVAEPLAERVDQEGVVLVKLDEVRVRRGAVPPSWHRKSGSAEGGMIFGDTHRQYYGRSRRGSTISTGVVRM